MRQTFLRDAKHADDIEVFKCPDCDGVHIALTDEEFPGEAFAQIVLNEARAQWVATAIMSFLGKMQ